MIIGSTRSRGPESRVHAGGKSRVSAVLRKHCNPNHLAIPNSNQTKMASSSKSSSEPVAPPAQPGLASTLSLVQAASGISFLGFAVVHFAGHSLVPFVGSIANADKVMSVLRCV